MSFKTVFRTIVIIALVSATAHAQSGPVLVTVYGSNVYSSQVNEIVGMTDAHCLRMQRYWGLTKIECYLIYGGAVRYAI